MPLTTKSGFVYPCRFTITQHRYVGGDDEGTHGYLELLEIQDPPPRMARFVIVFWGTGHPFKFWEFGTLEEALAAWGEHWPNTKTLYRQNGCWRGVPGPDLERKPWFYAAEGEVVEEDFLPAGRGIAYLTG